MVAVLIIFMSLLHGIDCKQPLMVGGFYAVYDDGRVNLSSVKAAVEFGRRQINQQPFLLNDYDLQIVWKDTQVNKARS